MALGRRRREEQEAWVATTDLPKSPGHVFYRKLNQLLAEADFDTFVEELCREHYADEVGRRGIPPGIYFRMLLVGYFEGIGSQRGIAWRCSDSLSLREFLGLAATESSPDHSSLTRVRERLPLEVHESVFRFVLEIAAEKKLLSGKTVAVDSTTLEANAAMKTIIRHDTGEDWKAYLKRLMQEQGLIEKDHEPTDEELRRFDKQRKDKKVSNEEWGSKTDPDSRIAKMKDGRTHLAYKAENVVDLKTDLVLAAEIYHADDGDTGTLVDSVMAAQHHLSQAGLEHSIDEVAADKGYHAAETLELAEGLSLRTYIPEPQRKHERTWTDKPEAYRRAVTNNRRRIARREPVAEHGGQTAVRRPLAGQSNEASSREFPTGRRCIGRWPILLEAAVHDEIALRVAPTLINVRKHLAVGTRDVLHRVQLLRLQSAKHDWVDTSGFVCRLGRRCQLREPFGSLFDKLISRRQTCELVPGRKDRSVADGLRLQIIEPSFRDHAAHFAFGLRQRHEIPPPRSTTTSIRNMLHGFMQSTLSRCGHGRW